MPEIAAALASPPEALQETYDVVIVGSGYGGAITAARLGVANAAAGGKLRIAVLERGAEHPTGTFPETTQGTANLVRSAVSPLGLFEIDRNPDGRRHPRQRAGRHLFDELQRGDPSRS